MNYSTSNVVYLEINEIPIELEAEFVEFLRIQVIHTVVRVVNGIDQSKFCHYIGVFAEGSMLRINKWIEEHNIPRKVED